MIKKIKNTIILLAIQNPIEEICGFICQKNGETELFPCNNIASDKYNDFEISTEDYLKCLALYSVEGIYHSHPELSKLSECDINLSEEICLPIISYGLKDKLFQIYIPSHCDKELLTYESFN